MTLTESAAGAVLPWFSLEAKSEELDYERLPQQNIDVCLMCTHSANHCDICADWAKKKPGRPRANIDTELLKEMMKLRRCNEEMCKALGINKRTLQRIKKTLN